MTEYQHILFSERAVYKIVVQGKLDESWSDRFGNMTIQWEEKGKHRYITKLSGLIEDQAALSGILSGLYELRFTVLSVECLGTEDEHS